MRVGPPVMLVVRDLNLNDGSASINKVCSVSGCDPDSLLNKVWSPHCGPKCESVKGRAWLWTCVLFIHHHKHVQISVPLFLSHGVLVMMLGG